MLKPTSHAEIRGFSSARKYSIIVNHFRPTVGFKFPSRFLDSCNRSCRYSYLSKNPWFVYSKSEDGLFCLPCVLFASGNYLDKFVSENFNHWSKKNSAFDNHNNNNYHKFAFYQFESLKSFMLRPQIAVDNQLGSRDS